MRPEAALTLHDDLARLPDLGRELLEAGGATHVCLGAAWFAAVAASAMPAEATPAFAVCPAGLIALQRGPGNTWQSLTTPYSTLWTPLPAGAEAAEGLGRRLGALVRGSAVTRLDALPAEWPPLDAFAAGLRGAGLAVRRFAHFGNWHEPVGGIGWDAYLAARPGSLRQTVRRKLARWARETSGRFSVLDGAVIDGPDGIEAGIAAYEDVYARSWKEPEPYPRFNAALMRALAPGGGLRLGVLWSGTVPIAAQFWAVCGGRAIVFKLAHDEAFRQLSPGTVVTAMMLRRLLNEEAVMEIDFGRGDDPYKRLWTSRRRDRIGLLAIDPRLPAGLLALARDAAGRARRSLRG